jgi:O-antigen/teichoic acid export membrane protein
MVIGPVTGAAFPRFSELVARGNTVALAQTYHKITQLLSVMVIPPSLVLALFAEHVVLLWTRDVATTAAVGSLVALLVIGNMLNGLTHPASFLQLAHGWMRLSLMANSVFILILVPAVYVFVPAYGAIAAPLIWITLNVGYVVLLVPLMHRRLLPAEMWRWYRQDVCAPALAALAAAGFIRLLTPDAALEKPFESAVVLAAAAFSTLLAATLATPLGRSQLRHYFRPVT